MNKSTSDTTTISPTILLFVLFTSVFLLQACDVIYTSSIIIPKEIEPIRTDAEKLKKDGHFDTMFDEFCLHKKFQIKQVMEPLPYERSNDNAEPRPMMCSTRWFYYASLWNRQAEYKIELFLMQPWSLWDSGKQKRFFCSATKDMFDFFKTSLVDEKATYKPDSRCPQFKSQQ